MSFDAITGTGSTPDIRAAAAPARAGSVTASLAAHARFNVLDAIQLSTRQASQNTKRTDDTARFAPSGKGGQTAANDQGGGRPAQSSTAFLTQSLAQEQDNSATASVSSQARTGAAAYAAAANRSPPTQQEAKAEILPPLQSSLNSGTRLDLAV